MNTTELLARVRDVAMVPDSDEDWNDAKWLLCASEALRERYTQTIPNLRAGYWLHRQTVTVLEEQSEFRIPARAIAQGLEKVEVSNDGRCWRLLVPRSDAQVGNLDAISPGQSYWFSLEADYVVVYPAATPGLQIRFSYYLRPSKLVALSAAGTVVVEPIFADLIRVSGDPTTLLGGTSGTLDIVNTTGANEVALVGVTYSNIVSAGGGQFDVTITGGTSLSRVVAGQVLRAPDTTDYIPLPVELHESLAARTASVYLLEHGDTDQAMSLLNKSEAAIKRFQDTAQPRVRAQPYHVRTRGTYLRRRYG